MKKSKRVGLLAAGRMTESPLSRFPLLVRAIGPIVAGNRRLASRYANVLRSGWAAEPEELSDCRMVVVQAKPAEWAALSPRLPGCSVRWRCWMKTLPLRFRSICQAARRGGLLGSRIAGGGAAADAGGWRSRGGARDAGVGLRRRSPVRGVEAEGQGQLRRRDRDRFRIGDALGGCGDAESACVRFEPGGLPGRS